MSLPKIYGEEIDTWTSITTNAFFDLEGSRGQLNKLLRFDQQIYAFQDKAISTIQFNSRVQINPSD